MNLDGLNFNVHSLVSAATTVVIAIVLYQAIRIPLSKLKRTNVKILLCMNKNIHLEQRFRVEQRKIS